MKILLSFLFSLPLIGQNIGLNCPVSVRAGNPLSVTTSLTNSQGSVGLQYTVTAPSALGAFTVTSTGSASASFKAVYLAGFSLIQAGAGPPPPGQPLNASMISDGPISTITWPVVPAGLGNQNVTISIAGGAIPPLATSATGQPIAVTAGPSCAVSVLPSISLCDINGDGVTDQLDVNAQRSMVLTFPQVSNCARSSSGCNITAVQIVINAAMGGACTATQ